MRKRNLFIRGSIYCFIVFVMVLALVIPHSMAATTQTITLEKLQTDFTGFKTDALADNNFKNFAVKGSGNMHFLPAAAYKKIAPQANYFARSYITGNIGNAGHNKTFVAASAAINATIKDMVKMRAWQRVADFIAANAEWYHPMLC